ncbi:MAG: hypothetical protein WAZ77_00615 [Candidatus Nitrosopolaris sp.]
MPIFELLIIMVNIEKNGYGRKRNLSNYISLLMQNPREYYVRLSEVLKDKKEVDALVVVLVVIGVEVHCQY